MNASEQHPAPQGAATPGFAARYGPWAVVTGAAAGVGLAFVHELHRRGLGVVMVDIDPAVVDTAADLSGPAVGCVADLTDPDWIGLVDAACAGREIGLAVANAGLSYVGWFLDMSAERRRALIDVNCRAVADMAAWALPAMVERRRGGFVVTSSGSALAGTAGVALYSATKAYAVNLVEALSYELRDSGVDLQAIVAPTMDTPGFNAGGASADRLAAPAVDPATVVSRALDALGDGPRWLADDGLAFAAAVPRADRVDMMGAATTAMYPQIFGSK